MDRGVAKDFKGAQVVVIGAGVETPILRVEIVGPGLKVPVRGEPIAEG